MNKAGISHLEMVLSFIIFIAAISVSLLILSPVQKSFVGESPEEIVMDKIIKKISLPIERYGVIVNEDIPEGIITLPFTYAGARGIRVENLSGDVMPSKLAVRTLSVEWGPADGRIVYIYAGDFASNADNFILTETIDSSKYKLGSYNLSMMAVSKKNIENLAKDYSEDYDNLKNEIGIPAGRDFVFSVVFSSDDKIESSSVIEGRTEVFADSMRVMVLREDGKRIFANLEVKVW